MFKFHSSRVTTIGNMNMIKLCYSFFICSLSFFATAQTGDSSASFKKEIDKNLVQSGDKKDKPVADATTTSTHPQRRIVNGSTKATVKNASTLNSDKDDFSPTFYQNGLIFCSSVKKNSKKDDDASKDDINLRYSLFDSLGSLTKPASFGHRANTKTNEGPSCFSANEDTFYLSRTASKGGKVIFNKKGKATLKIYIKTRDTTGNFVGEDILPFESESYSYCHPTLSADGDKLYFSSNMPGGFGGMDLWVTRRMRNGNWSQPINLGPRINTSKNEVFPYISESGVLYFSSDGITGGKGGYDLYRIEIENRTARTFPMGESFNTEFDDFGIMFLPKSDTKGYFSSNRKGGTGGDDIYEFEF